MTQTSSAVKAPAPEARPRVDRKLATSLGFAQFGSFLVWGAAPAVLLARHLEEIDPARKEANLALVITVGAVVSVLAQPVWGLFSDRSRSRFGRRAPYVLAGAFLGAVGLIATALSHSVMTVVVSWCVVQAAVTGGNGVLVAVLPDRVPVAVRGTVSAVLGFGSMAGILGGQILASALVPRGMLVAYGCVAGVLVLTAMAFVIVCPDPAAPARKRPRLSLAALVHVVWVNPRRHPDFAWAFVSRMLLMLGYYTVSAYQLYILQDYAGLGRDEALAAIPTVALISLSAGLVAVLVCGRLSDRLNRRKPFVAVSTAVIGLGLGMPFLTPSLDGVLVYAALAGFGFGCYQTVDTALVSEVLPSQEDAAKDLGVASLASHVPQVLAPALAGLVVVNLGYRPLFAMAFALTLLGVLCVLPIKSVR
jgi:MFS family permease